MDSVASTPTTPSVVIYVIVFAVMIIAGFYGGLVNYHLETDLKSKSKKKSIVLGIGASLLVPLFLKVISSDIFKLADFNNSNNPNIFIFFGLCLFAAIASKRFISTLSEKLIRETQEELEKIQEDVKTSESKKKEDNRALNLVDRIFEDDLDPDEEPVSKEKIKEIIKSTSSAEKISIFFKARRYRQMCTKEKIEVLPKLIPIFEALIECDEEKQYHRNNAQLAYIYKDQINPDLKLALTEIENAIRIRNSKGEKRYKIYEFFKSLCKIELDENFVSQKSSTLSEKNEILNNLKEAATNVRWNDAINKEIANKESSLSKWMKLNNISKNQIL